MLGASGCLGKVIFQWYPHFHRRIALDTAKYLGRACLDLHIVIQGPFRFCLALAVFLAKFVNRQAIVKRVDSQVAGHREFHRMVYLQGGLRLDHSREALFLRLVKVG